MSKRPLIATFAVMLMMAAIACGGGEEPATTTGGDTGGAGTGADAGGGEMIDPATLTDAGSVSGMVNFTGTAPEAVPIQMSADPYCLSQHSDPVNGARVVVNDDGTLQHVFVYVKEGLEGMSFTGASEPAELTQNGCLYAPHVLGVQTDQTITILNDDDTLHNVNAQPANNPAFNFAQPVQGMTSEVTFENEEVMIPVKCDVHPWMSSYIGVLPHPYFAVSGDDGSFSLDNLPPGDYVVAAWHESLGEVTQNVTVTSGETAEVSFDIGG